MDSGKNDANFPISVEVSELVKSRYSKNQRPADWDERLSGIDQIVAKDGRTYFLYSSGQQSPPLAGATIILRDYCREELDKLSGSEGVEKPVYLWTLYALP